MAVIKMTRAEYEAKYGTPPPTGTTKGAVISAPSLTQEPKLNLGESIWQSLVSKTGNAQLAGGQKIINSFQEGVNADTGSVLGDVGKQFKAGAGIAAGAWDVVNAPLTAIFTKALENLPPIIDKEKVQKNYAPLIKWANENPDLADTAKDLLNVAFSSLGAASIPESIAKQSVTQGLKEVVTAPVAFVNKTLEARRAANAVKDAGSVDTLAGSIVQGKIADVEKAKRALSSIDTEGINTYEDLTDVLNDKIKNVSTKLDETLDTDKTVRPMSELSLESKVGDSSVSHNFVEDAIGQLKKHYEAINDVVGLEKITQLEARANEAGLTIKEINDLAKLHGTEINAFNANGQAASGLSKQAAENTRTGLKSTARELFNNPVYKAADTEISSIIRTRDLATKMTEEVNKLRQKIKERTWGEKVGRLAGQALNFVGGNSPKGLIEYFLSRGTGLKTLNALDLEKALQKNLKQLQNALKEGATESDIEKALQAIIDGQTKP